MLPFSIMSSAYESDGGVSDGAWSETSTHLDIGDDYALRDVTQQTRSGRTKVALDGYEYTRATTTRVKISYRSSFYWRGCTAKLYFIASTMEYDTTFATNHTYGGIISTSTSNVYQVARDLRRPMQDPVGQLAMNQSHSPLDIWHQVVNEFITDRNNQALRTLTRIQVVHRAQNIRNLHFGGNNLSRVEMPILLNVKQSQLNFFQFNYAWTSPPKSGLEKSLLHYESLTLFIDAIIRCTPAVFKQCFVLMVYDKGTTLYVPVYYVLCAINSCGGSIATKEIICDFKAAFITAVHN
ncbi:hypothetical protein THRCLA_21487, partial [Thraustotheca clavata]